MIRYIFKRVALALLSLFILITIVYLLVASFSKNPFISGNLEAAEDLAIRHGLRDPILIRYGRYLADLFTGNFGQIYASTSDVQYIPSFFFIPLRWTLLITVPSLIFSIVIGVFLGVVAGYNRGRWIDTIISLFVIIFIGLPSFVIAPIMILIAINSNGFVLPEFIWPDTQGWMVTIKSIALPILTITLGSLAGYTILVRNQMVSVLTSNHVLIAKSKGLSQWEIFWKHIIRNISIPLISYIVPSFIVLLAGNVIIERFFKVPGSSNVIINAFPKGEINIVMFSILFFSGLSMLGQIILDISYVFIDPKIKYFEKGRSTWVKNLFNNIARKKNKENSIKQEEVFNE